MPRVTVVTGYYNRGPLLERTIESILDQTFRDLELIVFDDRSTDDTAERLAAISHRLNDPRFRYIVHDVNKGFVQGLRDAIAGSTGEYIAIQGSGDVSLPDRLELQVALLNARSEVGAVGGWYFNVQEDQGTRRLRRLIADDFTFEELLATNVFSHGEVMIRRSTYEKVGGYRTAFKYAQDRDLWLRIAKTARLATVPEPIYLRFVQFDGVSYVPSKVVMQTCFSLAAARLAQMSESDEALALARMDKYGPTAIVPVSDPLAQSKLLNASLRMMLFGSPRRAQELAHIGIVKPLLRRGLILLGGLYGSRLLAPVRPIVRRLAGIRS